MSLIDRFAGSLPSFLQPSRQGTPAAPAPAYGRDTFNGASFADADAAIAALQGATPAGKGPLDDLVAQFESQLTNLRAQIAGKLPAVAAVPGANGGLPA
ncbi:MAG: hypothetical protein JWM80_2803, partial [Cyanobacteria bacterium RYN_339]|nr:hypothetical protein [Cyanobacteria bacterium RYN_339]